MRTVIAAAWVIALGGCSGAPAEAPKPGSGPTVVVTSTSAPDEPLPTSRPPRTAVVAGHQLTYPDGRTVQLPRGLGLSGLARHEGGYLAAGNLAFEGTVGMHRLDAQGRIVGESWTSTGPPLVAPDGQVAWVSLVAPESGETGPTLIHAGERTQELSGLFSPNLLHFDGETVTFTARSPVRGSWPSATYVTDLVGPPRRIGGPPRWGRAYSPSGENWYRYRRHSLRIVTPEGETSIPTRRLFRTMGSLFWEDDRNLLGTYVRDGRMAVARIDLDGRLSIASPWRRKDLNGFAFLS